MRRTRPAKLAFVDHLDRGDLPRDVEPPTGKQGEQAARQRDEELRQKDDQRAHGVDGPDGGIPSSGGLTCDLSDDVTVAAQREQHLMAVVGRGQHLDPAR